MTQPLRVDPAWVRARLQAADGRTLLVCAYELHAKCERLRLENAITLTELQAREDALPSDTELIFYCQ